MRVLHFIVGVLCILLHHFFLDESHVAPAFYGITLQAQFGVFFSDVSNDPRLKPRARPALPVGKKFLLFSESGVITAPDFVLQLTLEPVVPTLSETIFDLVILGGTDAEVHDGGINGGRIHDDHLLINAVNPIRFTSLQGQIKRLPTLTRAFDHVFLVSLLTRPRATLELCWSTRSDLEIFVEVVGDKGEVLHYFGDHGVISAFHGRRFNEGLAVSVRLEEASSNFIVHPVVILPRGDESFSNAIGLVTIVVHGGHVRVTTTVDALPVPANHFHLRVAGLQVSTRSSPLQTTRVVVVDAGSVSFSPNFNLADSRASLGLCPLDTGFRDFESQLALVSWKPAGDERIFGRVVVSSQLLIRELDFALVATRLFHQRSFCVVQGGKHLIGKGRIFVQLNQRGLPFD
mmetsp:Transcript_8588/g.16247  ORF Transcript_8588/g.16247 Transcript_8588/m.16247 type:complete len:403 (+) Transcript_8588:715-1923(+)